MRGRGAACDSRGAYLAGLIRERWPEAQLVGAGGPLMREAGVNVLFDTTALTVWKHFQPRGQPPHLPWHRFRGAGAPAHDDALPRRWVIIDALQVVHSLREHGLWRDDAKAVFVGNLDPTCRRRINLGAPDVKQQLAPFAGIGTDLPWEHDELARLNLPGALEPVGHWAVERSRQWLSQQPAPPASPIEQPQYLALLPGSHQQQAEHNLALGLAAARTICAQHPELQPIVLPAPTLDGSRLQAVCDRTFPAATCPESDEAGRYEVYQRARCAIVGGGWAPLELSVFEVPMVVMHDEQTGPRREYLARRSRGDVPHFVALQNIALDELVVPELLGCSAPQLAIEVLSLLADTQRLALAQARANEAIDLLGVPDAEGAYRRLLDALFVGLPAGKEIAGAN